MGQVRDRTRPLTPYKWRVSRVYKWILELPVAIVLAVLWLVGGVLVGMFALVLYYLFWLLLHVAAGA